jgi:hypothetical protein
MISMQVDSANKHGILLEVVQLLTDLDLTISKAYISSYGGWFMDGKLTPLDLSLNLSLFISANPTVITCGHCRGLSQLLD